MIYTVHSSEWLKKYSEAQVKIDEILQDIELKRTENDKDTVELVDSRLQIAYSYRDDCEENYIFALNYENTGKGNVRLTSLGRCDYGIV